MLTIISSDGRDFELELGPFGRGRTRTDTCDVMVAALAPPLCNNRRRCPVPEVLKACVVDTPNSSEPIELSDPFAVLIAATAPDNPAD